MHSDNGDRLTNRLGTQAIAACALFLGAGTFVSADTVSVSTVSQLIDAINAANASGGGRTIVLNDGTYSLTSTLNITAPGVTLTSASGRPEGVVIRGDAMSASANVKNLVRISADDVAIRAVTLQNSGAHLVQIAGENDTDRTAIENCVLRNAYQQMIKVSTDPARTGVFADGGRVENCVFEYSAGIGPQYYIGGIDAHAARDWVVRGNTFRSISSPNTAVAEFAVHFWNGSANATVEGNTIINCDRGIGFGLDSKGNQGGVIRNNFIYHSGTSGSFADTGIALANSPGTLIYNNTVFLQSAFPWAIEYRYASTTNVGITNNVTNKPILSRDGGSATLSSNRIDAVSSWFVNSAVGNLHIVSSSPARDAGRVIAGLTDDIDGDVRPAAGVDLGADELVEVRPRAPTDVVVN